MSHQIILVLGSNTDPENNIANAQELLKQEFLDICFSDPTYTEPIGIPNSNPFLNVVAFSHTPHSDNEILLILKRIERKIGRKPINRIDHKITIDIDLLQWNSKILKHDDYYRSYIQNGIKSLLYFQTTKQNNLTMLQENSNARKGYLIGGGIASLSAAVFMIRDGRMQGKDISIFEESAQFGGSLNIANDNQTGYTTYLGKIFDYKQYPVLLNLLSEVPSYTTPEISIKEEIHTFNEKVVIEGKARLIAESGSIVNDYNMEIEDNDRIELMRLLAEPETFLNNKRINEIFSTHFFRTNFWHVWASTFFFQPWHSAIEFRRYIKLFMHDFPQMETQSGTKQFPSNQYESIIVPIINWLKYKGVTFITNCTVTDLDFISELAEEQVVNAIYYTVSGKNLSKKVNPMDMVIVTNGSSTSNISKGSMTEAPQMIKEDRNAAWKLWETITKDRPEFGKPESFTSHTNLSAYNTFTVTCNKENRFLEKLERYTRNKPGTGGLITFKDSNWLISISVPHQPCFHNQPEGITIFCGYGLSANEKGNYVKKKMIDCSGTELLTELLYHLCMDNYLDKMIETSTCIPFLLPYGLSQFMPHATHDRPQVRPKGYFNIAFASQFAHIEDGASFTMEYPIRCAMKAVYSFMNISEDKIPPYYDSETSLPILFKTIKSTMQ
jgi:oleate hydratase